ncbi:acyltransferase [Sporocytophaga myxococcoides]|uniref:acyltransferase n=1 Tax=Sporocytophaga myxococcoides TaxID=153721 RepID=UPI000409F42F|nr:acetyltransferase [Sporocytophaga myxococcoides]
MAEFSYLYKNRARFPFGSVAYLRAYAKRLLSIGELLRRNRVRNRLQKKGAFIHPCAEIGDVKADGVKKNLKIGAFSFLGRVELALHDKIQIGEKVCINDGSILLTASHDISDPEWKHKKAPIIIDDYAWICTNVTILPGVHVGRGAVLGAGAVVSKNVAPYDVVAGNPAKSTGKKRVEELNYNPCEFLASNASWLKG